MRRLLVILAVLVLAVACGKNDPLTSVGNAPYPAPPPPGYNVPQPFPSPGNSGYYGPPSAQVPNFMPYMPPGQPNQYYPFLPLDNYMRRNPPMMQYWTQFWGQWQNYAQNQGMSPYNFGQFWTNYCPQMWQGTDLMQLYGYMNQNVYYWVNPQTQFCQSCSGSGFWQNYYGYPYTPLDQYGFCDTGC
jgi:hypothetical protein